MKIIENNRENLTFNIYKIFTDYFTFVTIKT